MSLTKFEMTCVLLSLNESAAFCRRVKNHSLRLLTARMLETMLETMTRSPYILLSL